MSRKGRPSKSKKSIKSAKRSPTARASQAGGRPLISAAFMVKDGEEFLTEALASVQGFADELVVVDTGSSDRTIEIARSFGAKISHYEWKQDFSDARNETIRQSTGEWIFVIDADERLVVKPELIERFRSALRSFSSEGPYVGVSIDVINIRLDGSEMNSLPSVRFFPNQGKIKYENRVHNQLSLADASAEMKIKLCDFVKINHLGYDPVVYARRKKSDRSLPLIQLMLKDDPTNMVYQFYEGREFFIKKQYQESVRSLEKAVWGILEGHKGYFAETLKTLLSAYEFANSPLDSIETMSEFGIDREPEQPDFWYFKAHVCYRKKQYEEAARHFKEALDRLDSFVLKEVSQSHPIISNHPWRAIEMYGHSLWELDRFEEAFPVYLKTVESKPQGSSHWGTLLNNTIALAIEYKSEQLPKLLERLLLRPDTSFDMFIFRVQMLIEAGKIQEASQLLQWGAKRTRRIQENSTFRELWNQHCA